MLWEQLPSVAAVLGVAYLLYDNRRKLRSEADNETSQATNNITSGYDALFAQLTARVAKLESELAAAEIRLEAQDRENDRLRLWARLLFSQVVEAGGTPMKYDEVPQVPRNE